MMVIDSIAQECLCDVCQLKYVPMPESNVQFAASAAAFVIEHCLAHLPTTPNA